MKPKNKVLQVYPDAFAYKHPNGFVEIVSGTGENAYSLGGGDNNSEAWKSAEEAIEEIDDMDLLSEL